MTAEPLHSLTFEEFLAASQLSDERQEWVGGRVYAMTNAAERHELLVTLAFQSLFAGSLANGCRPFIGTRLVRLGDAAYVPDVMVVCDRAGHDNYETDLRVVIEVLSPSTANTDRREKSTTYSRAPSLEVYVILDPREPAAEVARLDQGWLTWESHGPGSVIDTSVGSLDLDALHAQLDRIATTSTSG